MKRFLLMSLFFLALLLRTAGLSSHPSGFTPDEASFGYDAYSILKTGRDQWGNILPLDLKSFGDHKMPLYTYLAIPSVAIFGLNEFAVRLPNAILGTLAVLVTYLLVLEWRKNETEALVSAFMLSISPWHIPMSRGAFEANLTTFLLPLSILFFFKGLKNSKYFVLSSLFASLNLFTYHSARLVTPLIFVFLIVSNWKKIKFDLNLKISALFILIFLAIVFYSYLIGAGSRVSSAGIISITDQVGNDRYGATLVGLLDWVARIFNNKLTFFVKMFVRNYLEYLSPQFFFTQGPGEYTYGMIPGIGVLYLIEGAFLIGFMWFLFSGRLKNANWLIAWILLAPIPAALALGPGYAANRAVVMIPALTIASALGAVNLLEKFKRKKLLVFFTFGLWTALFAFFLEDYFVQQRSKGSGEMIYGMAEVVHYISENEKNYSQIIISKKISEPHIFVAFYTKMDPKTYQLCSKNWDYETGGHKWVDQMPLYSLGKYSFRHIDWKVDLRLPGVLLVGTPEEFPKDVEVTKKVLYPNNKEAYWIVASGGEMFAAR